MKAELAFRPVRRPLARNLCVPGSADAGTVTETGPKAPLEPERASFNLTESKEICTRSDAPNPVPLTPTTVRGGPDRTDRDTCACGAVRALAPATGTRATARAAEPLTTASADDRLIT